MLIKRKSGETSRGKLQAVTAGLAARRFEAEEGAERRVFERHLKPWAPRFFADLETSKHGRFYRPVGTIGRMFMEIEAQAFAMDS